MLTGPRAFTWSPKAQQNIVPLISAKGLITIGMNTTTLESFTRNLCPLSQLKVDSRLIED